MQRPASRLAQAMADRASASLPSATTRGSASVARRIDSSAMPSPTGVRAVTTIAAIAWARASTPV